MNYYEQKLRKLYQSNVELKRENLMDKVRNRSQQDLNLNKNEAKRVKNEKTIVNYLEEDYYSEWIIKNPKGKK
jgi:hypothetical protein